MEVQIGMSKMSQYGIKQSRETFETIERPAGGQSIVMCAAKKDGIRCKKTSSLIANELIGCIAEGIRDGIAIRTVSNMIYANYGGTVEAEATVISVDLNSRTIVICRNSSSPVFYYHRHQCDEFNNESNLIGRSRNISSNITELPIEIRTAVVAVSSGIYNAGKAYGKELDISILLQSMMDEHNDSDAQQIADLILNWAIGEDQFRPNCDMSVAALKICPIGRYRNSRRLSYTFPIFPEEDAFYDDPFQDQTNDSSS